MDTFSTSVARGSLGHIISRVFYTQERIVLKKNGKEAAALVSLDDLRLLEALENEADAAAVKKALREKGTVAWDEVKARLGL